MPSWMKLICNELGFDGMEPQATGRPSYHPSTLLKIYIYGYLNRVQSSRRLEREAQRNLELMWLTGRLVPDFKTIADFRKDNGQAIRRVCREFIVLCRRLDLFSQAVVAIDGSKFKAVNNRDRNFTSAKMQRRMEQIEESINRYLSQLDTADRQEPTVPQAKVDRLRDKIAILKEEMQRLKELEVRMLRAPDKQLSLTDPDARSIEQAKAIFETNFFGLIRMTRAVVPHMRRQGNGRIINIGSVLGFLPMPYGALYAATKHAVEGYSESLDHELRTRGIRVSVIEPAYTRTQFDANFLAPDSKLDEYREVRALLDKVLKEVMATADEPTVVADVVLQAAIAVRPKLRYTAGGLANRLRLLRRFAPAGLVDAGIRKDLRLDASTASLPRPPVLAK